MALRSTHDMQKYTIRATDGEVGHVDDLLFDDEMWTARYLVANTGNWLSGRLVLVSPVSFGPIDWEARQIDVSLSRQQVENSPDIATDQPVSRRQELELLTHYNQPTYWGGGGMWGGAGAYSTALDHTAALAAREATEKREDDGDPHLRSDREVRGYQIRANDGEIGSVADFLIDDVTWTIRYLVVDTGSWLPGKKVLVAPEWATAVDWNQRAVVVDLARDAIEHGPEYDASAMLNREHETQLHRHHQRRGYWEEEQREEI